MEAEIVLLRDEMKNKNELINNLLEILVNHKTSFTTTVKKLFLVQKKL